MFRSAYITSLALAFVALMFFAGISSAQRKEAPRRVQDDAKFFSESAIDKANAVIAKIKEKHHHDLFIETVEKGPDKESFPAWARDRAKNAGVNGVYVVISKQPKHFQIEIGNHTRETGLFTVDDRNEVEKILKANMGKSPDEALVKVANFTLETMNEHAGSKAKTSHQVPGAPPWLGWVCAGLAVIVIIWAIFAVIRAISGIGRGGYGPGAGGPGGYGAPGYGGGGGGFFSSMLGGLFGAAAGMWMYNNFFGGHSSSSSWGQSAGSTPDAGSGADPNAAPDTDYSGSGGDYGDDGGDAGGGGEAGGGGDWGGDAGGGDAGGGDWGGGGGGGDFGGGGGGDFGGGGGGDW